MKRILYLILVLLGISFYSCNEDFLDRTPLDQISGPDFWTSESDLELYLNGLYDGFYGWDVAGGGKAPVHDVGTDLVLPPPNAYGSDYTPRLDGVINVPASGGGWNWGNVRNINYFLENIDKIESESAMAKHFVGEGYFFRAYYYYGLLRDFGDLPIITKTLTDEDDDILFGARQSRSDVVDFIIEDIDKAIANMQYGKDLTAHQTRLSKDIAQLFKARVCLYAGTWEKYHQGTVFAGKTDGTAYLQMAEAAARQVMDDGNYSLETGDSESVYANLFNRMDYAGSPEVLFFKHFDALTYGEGFNNQLWNWPNGYGITLDMTRMYLCEDGLPTALSPLFVGDSTLEIIETNRDPRLKQTIMVPGDIKRIDAGDTVLYRYDDLDPDVLNTGTGIESQKFRHIVVDPAEGVMNHSVDYILFRYAESLLIYAEARAELGTITQADVDMTINQFRDRVGMPDLVIANIQTDPNWPDWGYAISPILQEIRRERVTEMYGEGGRFDDLMRWRAHNYWIGNRFIGVYYTDPLKAIDPGLPETNGYLDPLKFLLNGPNNGYGFDPDRDYLRPLPSDQLTLNENLEQNPNW